ncbi:transglutaminase family protein [Mucisphaera sp.]|uniref:transglutaminase family protein n=1 Tax=Mucisphaera sp. TaxID=2913024 RepID=UPI003D0AABD1
MMRYRVRHETLYEYASTVNLGHNQVFLCPRDLAGQRCLSNAIRIDPEPEVRHQRVDYFGNTMVVFVVEDPHERMAIIAESDVEVEALNREREPDLPWEEVRGRLRVDRERAGLSALEFTFDSPLVQIHQDATAYAAKSFKPGRRVIESVRELTSRIHQDFRYDPTTTTVTTAVDEVFEQRSGVCQDFAHLQIAMLRGLGLPARYVSGYLRTFREDEPDDPGLVGADASHAWVSVYAGDGRWIDLDPTNDQLVGEHHVTLAWGRDYGDVAPVKGVIVGGGEQTIDVAVSVQPVR